MDATFEKNMRQHGRIIQPAQGLDVLLLTSEPRPLRQILASVRMALYGLELPIDLVVMRPEQFELSKDVIGGIAYPAAQTGKVVYEVA